MNGVLRFFLVLLASAMGLTADDSAAIRDALTALQRGDFATAERTLRDELKTRPDNAAALSLLGVALDNQKKYQEAESTHKRATALAPNSPDVWNNYANHQLGMGDPVAARQLYLKVLGLDSANYNANIQLVQIALKDKKGAEALEYISHLPANRQNAPNLSPLRIEALYLAGETAQADDLATRCQTDGKGDLGLSFSLGLALANAGQFERAEAVFTQALALAPSDFNLLFNLGAVAWHAGDNARARQVLEAALRQQPQNVDVLYTLASVDQAGGQPEAAVALLAQAARLAPQRSDIQKLLALAAGDLGALADSAAAWDRYRKLEPNDDVGRRERGFTAFQMGQFEQGVAELRWFVEQHPDDPIGHFELGAAEAKDDPAQALAEFDRALSLKSDLAAAHSARGAIYYQMGKPEASLADLEEAARLRPGDAVSLDRLGQTYLALDRGAEALRVLRKAAALAPDDSKTQLHLARALADAGEAAESKAAMERFRQLGPAVNRTVPGGLLDYLSLTPEQRRADYRTRVERMARQHPDDAGAQSTYLRLLLEDGDTARAVQVAGKIASLKPSPAVLADAGRALVEARLYEPAKELLQQAPVSSADVRLALAIATFNQDGPAKGIRLLDGMPDSARGGDYFVARAEMLDAAGNRQEAAAALQKALDAAPGQASLYLSACVFLAGKEEAEALRVSAEGLRALPGDRRIVLLRAVMLQRAGQSGEALHLLEQIETRWPEWPEGWVMAGTVLQLNGRREEAQRAFQTARALGDPTGSNGTSPDLLELLIK